MRVLFAPDSFKGSIDAEGAAHALAEGWALRRPDDHIRILPLADGGEGTLSVFASAIGGAAYRQLCVTGPDNRTVTTEWLQLGDGTAVLELARSSGLPLMRALDPLGAHTLGLGELARATLAHGASRLVIGLGGSASTDGGTGALRALGAKFLDRRGNVLPLGGAALADLAEVDLSNLIGPPIGGSTLLVDVTAPLFGDKGAAAMYGPQKGATASDVIQLERGLRQLAKVVGGLPDRPGNGAAGGTCFGLATLWGGRIAPGALSVSQLVGIPDALATSDVVITGEGRFDATSLTGKVVGSLLAQAQGTGVSIGLVVGRLDRPTPAAVTHAISLSDLAGSTNAAMRDTTKWLSLAGRQMAARLDDRPKGLLVPR